MVAQLILQALLKKKASTVKGNPSGEKVWPKGSAENVITVLRTMGVPANQYDIHVNFPGGVPTDGPSAGIAMAVGIYSAIYKIPVKNTVAMTGEIGIHGDVKPVGGVFSKVTAAKYAGAEYRHNTIR